MMHSAQNPSVFGEDVESRCHSTLPLLGQRSNEVFKEYLLVLHCNKAVAVVFSSLHHGFHFNTYRDPFIIRFPRRDDWLIAPTTAEAMTNGNFVEFIKFLLRRQFSYNVGKYYCRYICIYISTYPRTYLGVVGSLLRNKDNNCDAVKKVNGREHGKK